MNLENLKGELEVREDDAQYHRDNSEEELEKAFEAGRASAYRDALWLIWKLQKEEA